jgi:predicted nucleotidyltransferase
MNAILTDHTREIADLCRKYQVLRLEAFGSVVRSDFDPSSSDVDFLVEFFDPDAPGIADRYLALAEGLELIFQRPVDLVTKQAMKNPIFRQTVDSTIQSLYAA